jgi:pimeloyl-ACP methyl ester carboxylesterase
VNLWGVSYGTHLALAVMRDHPDGVRSVILDSAYPPDRDIYAEAPHNTDRAFDLLFDTCAADEACSAAYPDLRATFFEAVDRLNDTPARFETTNPLTGESYDVSLDGDSLMGLLFEFLYYTDVIPSLPQIIYQISDGSYGSAARLMGVLLASQEAVSRGMHFSTQCHDELAFSSPTQFDAALDEVPELKGLFEDSVAGTLGYDICAGWQSGRADPSVQDPVTSDIPTLVMAGEYDPITPPDWGRHAVETLANAFFFEYPGVGHAASLVAGCPRDMTIAFLEDPTAAPDDACIPAMGPVQWVMPAGQVGPIQMEPFTNATMGIQGVLPAGWDEISLGAYARQDSSLDVALVVAQAAPMSAQSLLALLTGQLGLERDPDSVGEREANDIAWTLYAVEVQGLSLDIAVAEEGGLALLVMLQSDPEERDALYEAVFLPVVDGLTPTE